jgi:uncharacterized protein YdhG (YjbR/CyaY superfamily)
LPISAKIRAVTDKIRFWVAETFPESVDQLSATGIDAVS